MLENMQNFIKFLQEIKLYIAFVMGFGACFLLWQLVRFVAQNWKASLAIGALCAGIGILWSVLW